MRRRLSAIGILCLVTVLVAVGLLGCSRAAEERESEAGEPGGATVPPGGQETTPVIGETVVSAVTPAGETPGVVATLPPAGESPVAPEPTATTQPAATEAVPTSAPPPPSSGQGGTVWHTVQQGETLSSIARRYGTTWQAIAQANGVVNPNQIYVGQRLRIPTSTGSSGGTTTGCRIRHTVKSGEWVWQIARTYGVSPYDILAANGLTIQSADPIYAGTVLCIP